MALIRQPSVLPTPGFEENPVDEVVTNDLVGVFAVDRADPVPDRGRHVGDGLFHLRRKRLFTGRPYFLRRCAPEDWCRRVRPFPVRGQPEQG